MLLLNAAIPHGHMHRLGLLSDVLRVVYGFSIPYLQHAAVKGHLLKKNELRERCS